MARRHPVIEFAGLPGAGKTTICRHLATPHGGKGAVPLRRMRVDAAVRGFARAYLGLLMTIRPLTIDRLRRSVNLLAFLRHYGGTDQPLVLDQGVVQKLWSILIDAESYSPERLRRVVAAFRPLAPDRLIVVAVPAGIAARRVAERRHGNSRFDGRDEAAVAAALAEAEQLLADLVALFAAETGVAVTRLESTRPPAENAGAVDALLAGR